MKKNHLFFNGKLQKATSGKTFSNINPATNTIIDEIDIASTEDVERAVASAKKGFEIWSKTPAIERGRILKKAAQLLRNRNQEIAEIEVKDTGKPISEAVEVDVTTGADALEYYGGIAPTIRGEHYDLGNSFAFTRREPLGICAGIGAWNYPIQIACWKTAPALACGNSMIYKPAELTPSSALILAEALKEAGLPDGVFNVLQGEEEVGKMLTGHKDIRKVSLTGEVSTGKKVMEASASSLKHVTLELGGKSPLIICKDADIDQAVQGAMMANFYTQGEICSNGTRVFVEESIKKEFIEKLIEKTQKLKIGDPMDMQTQIGALISKEHYNKVMNYIEIGKKEAKLIIGGSPYNDKETKIKDGFFVTPTIFDVDNDEARIVKEEIFGPVMSILTFKTNEEALRRANSTEYGLAAGVFTKDLQCAHHMANNLEAGMCWINNYNINPMEVPFGPYKQSGFGKENGLATIDEYTQLKTVYIEMENIVSPY
ncbi:MAG: betaine-aldehyde dehydrogenase [Bacteroidota bacterium]|nr:betaine-aldehyde dehydrogenase [Bacteroidota bacterium]